MTFKVASYIRLSQETAETLSPDTQRRIIGAFCDARGWDIVEEFVDLDRSAYKQSVTRPDFDAMMERLGEFDAVVFWKLDRLIRSFLRFSTILGQFEEADTQMVSCTEPLDTSTPTGKAMAGFLAAQAEQSSLDTSMRVSAAQETMLAAGRWKGGTPVYGLRSAPHPDGAGKVLEIDPERAERVRQMARRILDGQSARQVADWLNTEGVPGSLGGRWGSTTVVKLLRNETLTGAVMHGGRVVERDGATLRPWPAVLDLETWRKVQKVLDARAPHRARPRRGATLLSGLLECGRCGGPMVGWTSDDPSASYQCSRRSDTTTACAGNYISVRRTDEYVTAAVLRLLTDDVLDAIRSQLPSGPDPTAGRLVEVEHEIERLEADRRAGMYDGREARFRRQWQTLAGEYDELMQRRSRTAQPLSDLLPSRGFPEVWEKWPQARRRQALRALIDRVVVAPARGRRTYDAGRLDIVWRRSEV